MPPKVVKVSESAGNEGKRLSSTKSTSFRNSFTAPAAENRVKASPGKPAKASGVSLAEMTEVMTAALKQQAQGQHEMIRCLIRDEIARGVGTSPPSPGVGGSLHSPYTTSAGHRTTPSRRATMAAGGNTNPAEANASYTAIRGGDLITLRLNDVGLKGHVIGSMTERNVAVEAEDQTARVTRRFDDCVFRLCSKLNYRAQTELNKLVKAISKDPSMTKKSVNLEQVRMRVNNEKAQNDDILEKQYKGEGFPIKYGDVVQLEHHKSQLFLAMHKTPAPVNSNCRKVSLKSGSFAAHFRILPRFKVRSIGSLVYANDEIVLQSVKFDPMVLGASSSPKDMLPSPVVPPALGVRLPTSLRHGPCFEANGALEIRSFSVKLYARFGELEKSSLVTGLHQFRLFHPEEGAFVSASGDADKGEVLDARKPSKQSRTRLLTTNAANGGTKGETTAAADSVVPAHIPYLKNVSGEVSNPANFSAKAVWRFENVDRTRSSTVKWHSPLRLRHVASGKYLSVDSLNPTKIVQPLLSSRGGSSAGSSSPGGSGSGGNDAAVSGSLDDEDTGDGLGNAELYNVALVDDADVSLEEGAFGSPSSLVFHLAPTDVTGDTLKRALSTLRLEHRTAEGETLFFLSPREPKPLLASLESTDDEDGTSSAPSKSSPLNALDKKSGRLLFSSKPSSIDVLKLLPLGTKEGRRIDILCARVRLFLLYANLYQSFGLEGGNEQPPTELCEAVVVQCLGLIDDLRRGAPPPPRHATTVDAMKEANATLPALFSTFFSGEPDPLMQRIAMEVKVLDAVFAAALAPYNRALVRPSMNDRSKALAKFLYVALQRAALDSPVTQEYFANRSSRSWFPPSQISTLTTAAANGAKEQPAAVLSAVRRWSFWRDIIISQGEDSYGATVTLGQLLGASETIVAKLVSNELMVRFKNLIKRCGPQPRLINLFGAICTVAGKPNRANQEMCIRTLWMNLPDRYSVGVTFHECDDANVPKFGPVKTATGDVSPAPPNSRAPSAAPTSFLGKTKENVYGPICVAWTGADDWVGECGSLFWSARALGLPVTGSFDTGRPEKFPKGGVGRIDLVPIESLLWVLEPEMLCEPVTGVQWTQGVAKASPFDSSQGPAIKKDYTADVLARQSQLAGYLVAQIKLFSQMVKGRSSNCIAWLEKSFSYDCLLNMASNPRLPFVFRSAVIDFTLALYVDRFPQIVNSGAPCLPELLWIYDEPSYDGTRKSTTPVLQPLTLSSEAAFPFFFVPPLSRVAHDPNPVLSFPTHFKFFLLRSLANNVVKSLGTSGRMVHSLAALNNLGGAAIRGQQGLLDFGFQSTYPKLKELCEANAKLLDGRSDLEKPGTVFDPPEQRYRQSGGSSAVVTKMKREVIQLFLDVANLRANYRLAKLLYLFKTHADLIKNEAWVATEEGALRQKVETLLESDKGGDGKEQQGRKSLGGGSWDTAKLSVMQLGSVKGEGASFVVGRTDTDNKKLFEDFESLFPGGSDDASKLDLSTLSSKPDLDLAIVDCMMYDDDALLESALGLLDQNYGQRRKLMQALKDSTLLPDVQLPVFGDIHSLRNCLNDLLYQTKTSSSWGVKSLVSGPFDNSTFSAIMNNVNKLLLFVHTPPVSDEARAARQSKSSAPLSPNSKGRARSASKGQGIEMSPVAAATRTTNLDTAYGVDDDDDEEDASHHQGYFQETDLQGKTYECRGLWSLDVAAKWGGGGGTQGDGSGDGQHAPCQDAHQAILGACNLQAVLAEAMVMDHEIAWKGSICTEREKVESERRLTMVKRAFLQLASAFVEKNKINQEALFEHIGTLQALATPPELQADSSGFDERRRSSSGGGSNVGSGRGGSLLSARVAALKKEKSNGASSGTATPPDNNKAWPFSVPELAQDLIMRIVRNDVLSERIKRPLIELFASLVNATSDCSSASALDFLFVVSNPVSGRPIRENQTMVAETLLNHSSFSHLADAIATVVSPNSNGLFADPARLVQLVRTVIENKNEYSASQLMQHANLTIDATCNSLVALVSSSVAEVGADSVGGAMSAVCGELGSALLSLLAEQVHLLPMNAVQVGSEALWNFLRSVAAQVLEALSEVKVMDENELMCTENLFDVLERIFSVLTRFGLVDDILGDGLKAQVVGSVTQAVDAILSARQLTPDNLRMAFSDMLLRTDQKIGLDREHFSRLVMQLEGKKGPQRPSTMLKSAGMVTSPSKKAMRAHAQEQAEREAQLEAAFDMADEDGNGLVDLYEFVGLYIKVTTASSSKEAEGGEDGDGEGPLSGIASATGMSNEGHTFTMRTVETGERILAMAKGNGGAKMLLPPRFTRSDKYPRPRDKGGKHKKLFQRTLKVKGGAYRKEPPLRSLPERLEAFKTNVMSNSRILGSLQRRRFSLVTVLEKGIPAPPPKPGRALTYKSSETKEVVENRLCSAVAVDWNAVTKRLVSYCRENFYEQSGNSRQTVQLILETWMAHLLKARTLALEEDGVTPAESIAKASVLRQVTPHELSDELYGEYCNKQSVLNSLGVTELVANIISNIDDVTVGGLPDIALEVLIELLSGESVEAADTLYMYLIRVDTEGRFIKHLDRRLDVGVEGLLEAKKRGGFGVDGDMVSNSEIEEACDYMATTTRFMQLLCEGHNTKFQNLMREQPMYSGEFNLIKKTVEALVLVCETSLAVSYFQTVELEVVSQLLALLVEVMQGPCPGNQEEIVDSDALVAINNIMPAVNDSDLRMSLADPEHMDIRGKSCVLLAACVEGREDFECHKTLIRKLEVGALFGYEEAIEAEIRMIRGEASGRLLSTPEKQKVETLQAALVAVVTIKMELRQEKRVEKQVKKKKAKSENNGDAEESESSEEEEEVGPASAAGSAKVEHSNTKQPLVGIVEVAWKGQIERNVFAMPIEVAYLTASTKTKFLEEVDLSTTEKRMSKLLRCSDSFYSEMRLIHNKAERSSVFRFLHFSMPTIKMYLYVLVVLLNLNTIMAPNKIESGPARALTHYLSGKLDLDHYEVVSLGVTVVLFVLLLTGYLVIIAHLGTTNVPMVVRELETTWADVGIGEKPRNLRAWGMFTALFGLALVVVGIHFINYPATPEWYLTVACLLVPVFLASFRTTVIRPTNRFQRNFCIAYDVVVRRDFLRNHAVLALCSVLGMYKVEFFTLELLDVINISPVIGDIIQSVTAPGKALFLTLYLFVITSVIYASFGMAYFPNQLMVPTEEVFEDVDGTTTDTDRRLFGDASVPDQYDFGDFGQDYGWEEEEGQSDGVGSGLFGRLLRSSDTRVGYTSSSVNKETCKNLLECSFFVFYQGMSESGNLKTSLRTASPGQYNYIPRIVFDSVFFVWVGIVLMNIVTGLMVDTFSALRGEKVERQKILESECFVCGLQRGVYDDLGLGPGTPSFVQHLATDHDLWMYVYFVAYLKEKDPTEYNGIESFVRGEIDNLSLEWLPNHTSFVIEDQDKGNNSGAAAAQAQVEKDQAAVASAEKIEALVAQVSALQQAVATFAAGQQQLLGQQQSE